MNLVIEGPDGSGKSTLAQYLSDKMHWPVIDSPGPTKTADELNRRVRDCLARDCTIFDRHPVVSEYIYGTMRGHIMTEPALEHEFYESDHLIIYSTLRHSHVRKPHDNDEHWDMVKKKRDEIHYYYAIWASERADVFFRGDMKKIESLVFDPVRDVKAFHEKMGIQYGELPRALDLETLQFRLKFLREETNEYDNHASAADFEADKLTRAPHFRSGEFGFDSANFVHHLAASLDALADLLYVAVGTSYLHGFDLRSAFARVHKANMAKQRSPEVLNAENRMKLKVIKPPGWEPPHHEDLVETHVLSSVSR